MKVLGVYSKDQDSYDKVRKITDSDYNEYKKIVKRMYSVNEDLSLLTAVRGNYTAYIKLMQQYTAIGMSSSKLMI